eukprot:429401_1
MWSNPHDEYGGANANKRNTSTIPNPKASSQRTISKNKRKRPQRPKFDNTNQNNNVDDNDENTTTKSSSNYLSKPNPWTNAHDEYPQKKPILILTTPNDDVINNNNKHSKSPKSRRPIRIRFETADDMDNIDDNHPEDNNNNKIIIMKSNRPLNNNNNKIIRKRPLKKKPNYVNADNIHAQQFHSRSGYRAKSLPPNPNRKTNQLGVQDGQANFKAMIKQAATMEGLDKSDIRVQRMIQRLGDQMNGVSGFIHFLQNKDDELARVVSKQDKRKKQMDNVNRKINNTSG